MIISNRDPEFIKIIKKSYISNPVFFFFPFYDSVYYPELTEVYIDLVGNDLIGYLLIWRGKPMTMHLMGNIKKLIDKIPLEGSMNIHAVISDYSISDILRHLRGLSIEINWSLTMVCTKYSFKDFGSGKVRRLDMNDVDYLLAFERERSSVIDYVEVLMRLLSPHWHYYGAFVNNELVSAATTSAKLPEVWYISDVYTKPKYRNKGFAKAVVSAITRDAVSSGAMAMLQVTEDNTAAIRVYRDVGYVAVYTEYLISVRP